MIVQPNDLLLPTTKAIKPFDCSLIAVEGPNILSKVSLAGISIPFDSQYVSRVILPAGATDIPIIYGTIGNDATFLTIKVNYENQRTCPLQDNYIEYYYADDRTKVRPIGQLLVLSGTINHRHPQIYLNNPLSKNVQLDILSATIAATGITSTPSNTVFTGLYWNSVISDIRYGSTTTGSTSLQILNQYSQVILSVPYSSLNTITVQDSSLIINTSSNDLFTLEFLSVFNMMQAHSRINWVRQLPNTRILTASAPALDLVAPVIDYNYTGSTAYIPLGSGITASAVRYYFTTGATDNQDGNISEDEIAITITPHGQANQISTITTEGVYDITLIVSDIAGNTTYNQKTVVVDGTAPVFYLNTLTYSGATIIMNLSSDTQTPGSIYYADINRYFINYVNDAVDGIIPNSAVTILINSGAISEPITSLGSYTTTMTISDSSGNIATSIQAFNVVV